MLENLFFGILLGTIAAFLSYKFRFLTLDGAFAAFLLGSLIFGFGGWQWSLPLLVFFVFSSLLSKLRKKLNADVDSFFEKSGVRDAMQVASNGGLGGILIVLDLIWHNEIFYLIYVAIMASVCADTWATEIGTLFKTGTYNVLNLRPVEQGVSGGISVTGTSGALLGSLFIAVSSAHWINFTYFYAVVFAGFCGSLIDSLLGATLQAQFSCRVCGKQTERDFHCQKRTLRLKGFAWLNNDMVNLLAGLSGGILILLFQTLSGIK